MRVMRRERWLTGTLPWPSPVTSRCSSVTNDAGGRVIDYFTAVSGGLQLVPDAEFRRTLEDDYGRMVSAGMLLDDDEDFEDLMRRCSELQDWVNSIAAG